jgi:hypothetical protein
VGDLGDDAGAVAGILLGAGGAAVLEVVQELDALGHDVVRLLPLEVDDKADAARVMLVGAVV